MLNYILHSIFQAGFKNDTIQNFLGSIGLSFKSPSVIFEDNQGTIKLLRTHRLTDTVRHHDVKLARLNEHFLRGTFIVAYLNTKLMLVDCITKPVNGVQLHLQVSYCIGKRFYPASSTQYYVDLELHNYFGAIGFSREPNLPVDCYFIDTHHSYLYIISIGCLLFHLLCSWTL